MTNLLSIGRFAELTRLSIRMLRHYDELGLLRPALVDGTSGYRYYSPAQAEEAERIRLLRSLDMPLEEIHDLLRANDPVAVRERLDRHRTSLEAQVARYREALAALDRLGEPVAYAVAARETLPQRFLGVRCRTTMAGVGGAVRDAFSLLFRTAGDHGLRPAGPPFGVYHADAQSDDLELDAGLPIPRGQPVEPEGGSFVAELPGGPAAITLHAGPYAGVGRAYSAIEACASRGAPQAGRRERSTWSAPARRGIRRTTGQRSSGRWPERRVLT